MLSNSTRSKFEVLFSPLVIFFVATTIIIGLEISKNLSLNESVDGKKHICGCAFNCMDARVQSPVEDGTKRECCVDMVDVITQAGIVKVLAENKNKALVDNFKYELEISVKKHGTKSVSIVAHHDCAGNPVSKEEQVKHLRQAKKTVESFGFNVEIILLWVDAPFKKAELIP